MAHKRILIVGGVAGGATCAARIRRLCEECEIIIFEMGSYVSFANCGLPYFIGDVIVEEEKLLVATPELFKNRFNIQVCTDTEVLSVNRADKTLDVRDLTTGQNRVERYDALVLSTGAAAVWPEINGINLPGIYALRTIPDSREIRAALDKMKRAVVMGAGYLGLELAENLSKRGVKVTVLQSSNQVMPALDQEMAVFIAQHLQQHGIECRLNSHVSSFQQNPDQTLTINLASGEHLVTEAVMVSIGVKPRAQLAARAGLELGQHGGIRVNETMQTSDPHIWAVGDVVEVRNFITNEWQLCPLAGPANRQGRLAASHIAGKNVAGASSLMPYRGVQGTSVCGIFGLTVATTGVNEKALKAANFKD
ncbi:MAG: NAD(P)/FAD-dependent oxidoreductase, partial [Gammaproteobacteria bacterium]